MICNMPKFRDKLKAGQLCLGSAVSCTDPAVTEALCDSVDFVWLDLEHTPISLESLQAHLIAARAGGAAALVRVPSSEVAWTKRVLDIGAEGIILPQARSVETISEFVAACRYPPQGRRGFAPRRASNYGRQKLGDYLKEANEKLFVSVQIETMETLAAVDEILKIPGIDSLVIGPADLAGAMLGKPGEVSHPEILKSIEVVCAKAKKAGVFVGIGMGVDPEFAVMAAERGVQWLQCGGDISFMLRAADAVYRDIRARCKPAPSGKQRT